MKNLIKILLIGILFTQCKTEKTIYSLKDISGDLFPIGQKGKWGYANEYGDKVIELKYDEVNLFSRGIAAVKFKGKWGYLTKKDTWHIKPKYDTATSFLSNCATVSTKQDTFAINLKGKKVEPYDACIPLESGYCESINQADPNDYTLKINNKYELVTKYNLVIDSTNTVRKLDSTNIQIDTVYKFSRESILLKKENKYCVYPVRKYPIPKIDLTKREDKMLNELDKKTLHPGLNFKYDKIKFLGRVPKGDSISFAKVLENGKWGIINSKGKLIFNTKYNSINFIISKQIALIEYEQGMFGYKRTDGTEYFKR